MDIPLEERLAALEKELTAAKLAANSADKARRHRRNRITAIVAGIAACILATVGGANIWNERRNAPPLPANVVQASQFPLYYPADLPGGYRYADGSADAQSTVTIYKLRDADKLITINQQARPEGLANLKSIDGMAQAATKLGSAYVSSKGAATAIIMAERTLISLNGTGGATAEDISAVADSLEKIN